MPFIAVFCNNVCLLRIKYIGKFIPYYKTGGNDMRKILVVFASESSAAQIKKYLFSEHNIISKILPTPEDIAVSGCGFSLSADFSDIGIIRETVKQARVSSKGIFDAETFEKL